MLVPNRHANTPEYRYGFQGQEMDDELKGEGNSLNYTYRMHDPRVGRFFAVDPLTKKYPHYTPYQFGGNRLLDAIELEGLEEILVFKAHKEEYIGYKQALRILSHSGIMQELLMEFKLDNLQTNIYINVVNFTGNREGDTNLYETEKENELVWFDITADNPNLVNIKDINERTLSKDKQAIMIRIDSDLVINAATDPKALMNLAETIVHEIYAHALKMKKGTDITTAEEDHQVYFNDPNVKVFSPKFEDIKADSPAGRFKSRIEKSYHELYDKWRENPWQAVLDTILQYIWPKGKK